MIPFSQTRPLSINIFAAAFLAAALIALLDGLWDLRGSLALARATMPRIDWNIDMVIIGLSARFTIALIPIALVWLTAANFARWMVTVLAFAKLVSLSDAVRIMAQGGGLDPAWATTTALTALAVVTLFLPPSAAWFAKRQEADPAVFE